METRIFKNFFLRRDFTFPARRGIKLPIRARLTCFRIPESGCFVDWFLGDVECFIRWCEGNKYGTKRRNCKLYSKERHISLHKRRFMSQARQTRHFDDARRSKRSNWGSILPKKIQSSHLKKINAVFVSRSELRKCALWYKLNYHMTMYLQSAFVLAENLEVILEVGVFIYFYLTFLSKFTVNRYGEKLLTSNHIKPKYYPQS